MQENISIPATITSPCLIKAGNGSTTIIMVHAVPLEECKALVKILSNHFAFQSNPVAEGLPGGFILKIMLNGFYRVEPHSNFFFLNGHKFYIGMTIIQPNLEEEKSVNPYEKQGTLQEAIQDAERRLGSYLATEGCEKTDKYAQYQIKRINDWSKQLDTLYNKEVTEDGNN